MSTQDHVTTRVLQLQIRQGVKIPLRMCTLSLHHWNEKKYRTGTEIIHKSYCKGMRVRRIEGYNFLIEKVAFQISKIQTVYDTLAYTKTVLDRRFLERQPPPLRKKKRQESNRNRAKRKRD